MNNFHSLSNANAFGWGPLNLELDAEKQAVLDQFALKGPILDLGCAFGKYTEYLRNNGFQVTGVDHSNEFIKKAKKLYPKATFKALKLNEISSLNQNFNTVVAFDFLEHVVEKDFFSAINSVHAQRLILCIPFTTHPDLFTNYLLYGHHQDTTHLRTYTPASIQKLLKTYKFKTIYLKPSHPLSTPSLLLAFLPGPLLLRKLIRKILLTFFKPPTYYTNLILVADRL